jgi:hypothetical protein
MKRWKLALRKFEKDLVKRKKLLPSHPDKKKGKG